MLKYLLNNLESYYKALTLCYITIFKFIGHKGLLRGELQRTAQQHRAAQQTIRYWIDTRKTIHCLHRKLSLELPFHFYEVGRPDERKYCSDNC